MGIKDSSGDLTFMMRMIAAVRPDRPDFSFLNGWEAVLVPSLLVGCDGGTHGSANVVPELLCKTFNLTRAGHVEEAIALQYRMLKVFDVMLSASDFPDGIREVWNCAASRAGQSRQPQTEKHAADVGAVKTELRRVLDEMGLFQPAGSACQAGKLAAADVTRR